MLSRVRVCLYLNMFGYDDELNAILMAKVLDPNVTMLITLDKSRAGGKDEEALLDAIGATSWPPSTPISPSANPRRINLHQCGLREPLAGGADCRAHGGGKSAGANHARRPARQRRLRVAKE